MSKPSCDHGEIKRKSSAGRPIRCQEIQPFIRIKLTERADKAWESAKLDRITLHECRHIFASLMIAAGVNGKALATFMGHATISITLDRYGHLVPGSEAEAAGLLDAYLTAERERDDQAARTAGAVLTGAPTAA